MQLLRYIGIPYRLKESSFTGADCWGLCMLFAKNELKIEFPKYFYDVETYIEEAEHHINFEKNELGKRWKSVKIPDLGNICLFRINGHEAHCGIHLSDKLFLHTLKGRSSCIEEFSHINWSHRHCGSYKWLG